LATFSENEVTMNSPHRFILTAALALTTVIGIGIATAQTPPAKDKPAPPVMGMPEMPPPGEHHKWLEKLVGNWTIEAEMSAPGMDQPIKSTGTDTVRSFGGRWIIGEFSCQMPAEMGGGPINAILQLGYNSETGKYQGTWIDTMQDHMWVYVGTLDATKKILTLEAEGPNMMDPTSTAKVKYRDVIEIKSDDHRTLTSSAFQDGKWVEFNVMHYHRAGGKPGAAAGGAPAAGASGGTAMNITNKPIEIGCGKCIYHMAGVKGCELAAKVDGKTYMLMGKHGQNPHHYCEEGKPATVTGTIENDVLMVTTLKVDG